MKRKIVKRYDIRRAHEDYLLRRYGNEAKQHGRLARKAFSAARHARSIGRMDHLLRIAKYHDVWAKHALEIVRGVFRRRKEARGS